MLSLMEINESNKEKLINELKERVEDADSSVIESVRNILSKVKSDGDDRRKWNLFRAKGSPT